jgi:hypothetical protein
MSQDARTFTVNEADLLKIMRAREEAFLGGAIDAKRPAAWVQYGYPEEVTFDRMFQAYSRGGPGQGAVHRLLDGCWQELPRIKAKGSEDETPWEKKVAEQLKAISAWAKLRDFDRRNMIGRFSALIYRVGDGRALREPLKKGQRLVDIVPVYENQLKVTAWEMDEASEQFGQPTMFQYRTRAIQQQGSTQGRPETWVDVHPSRVQILAEGSVGDMFDGVPLLQAGFNHMIDLEKIAGGSAESYLKNSARSIVFAYDPQANVQALQMEDGTKKTVREVHEEQTRSLNKNIDASIVIQGGKAETLQTQMFDPKPSFEVAANLFAAAVRIPFTILFGQQTGRLASDEDQSDMVKRCKSRQATELTPMLEQFVKRMQDAGLIDAGEFEVEWPDIAAPTDEQRVDRLVKMTTASKTAFDGGITEPLFDANELREVVGYEKRPDDGMPDEDDLDAMRGVKPPDPNARPPGAKPAVVNEDYDTALARAWSRTSLGKLGA